MTNGFTRGCQTASNFNPQTGIAPLIFVCGPSDLTVVCVKTIITNQPTFLNVFFACDFCSNENNKIEK